MRIRKCEYDAEMDEKYIIYSQSSEEPPLATNSPL